MYAVVRYYNYRKEQDLKILNVFYNKDTAIKKAYEYAEKEFKHELEDELQEAKIVDSVQERWLLVYDAIAQYTIGDGFGSFVFAVITLPQPE
jgi:hypothetical protein